MPRGASRKTSGDGALYHKVTESYHKGDVGQLYGQRMGRVAGSTPREQMIRPECRQHPCPNAGNILAKESHTLGRVSGVILFPCFQSGLSPKLQRRKAQMQIRVCFAGETGSCPAKGQAQIKIRPAKGYKYRILIQCCKERVFQHFRYSQGKIKA